MADRIGPGNRKQWYGAVASALLSSLFATGHIQAQTRRLPRSVPHVKLVPAAAIQFTGQSDSNSPAVWDSWDGRPEVFVMTSVAGRLSRQSGADITQLGPTEDAAISPEPGGGVWIEAVIADNTGKWYGFYHNEIIASACGDWITKTAPRIGVAVSLDQGSTWANLGIILEMAPETMACDTSNEYFVGGVGDFSALLDRAHNDVYIYFSQYGREREDQGVAVARIPWADMDDPVGKVTVWNDGVWLPPSLVEDEAGAVHWEYPHATPISVPDKPWHTGEAVNAFWGPSIHWNEALQQYVMLLNRTKDDAFTQEGIYVSFNPQLDDPAGWSPPSKIADGGGWYPQVVGLEVARGTDTLAGRSARFFQSGRSDYLIEFSDPVTDNSSTR